MTETDDTFLYWAQEREDIRLRREQGCGFPWTKDSILSTYKFCNVNREHDRTTRFIKKWIRGPFDQHETLIQAICLARFVNKISTLKFLLEEGAMTPEKIYWDQVEKLLIVGAEDGPVWGNAYVVKSDPGIRKATYICSICKAVDPKVNWKTRRQVVEDLPQYHGFGEFMAGQVAADLSFTSILRDAPDHFTFAPRGPGGMRGMNRFLNRPLESTLSQEQYEHYGRMQMEMLRDLRPDFSNLTLHDVASNINCEVDKYCRLKEGSRHSLRRYRQC